MNANGLTSNTYLLLAALPIVPQMYGTRDITKAVPQLKNKVNDTVASLPSTLPLCQEGNKIGFISEEAKQRVLSYYGEHEKWNYGD